MDVKWFWAQCSPHIKNIINFAVQQCVSERSHRQADKHAHTYIYFSFVWYKWKLTEVIAFKHNSVMHIIQMNQLQEERKRERKGQWHREKEKELFWTCIIIINPKRALSLVLFSGTSTQNINPFQTEKERERETSYSHVHRRFIVNMCTWIINPY